MSAPPSGTRKLVKHSSIYAIGNISRQLIGFIMLPVYTRYLSPADYGVIGLLTFAVSLIEGVLGARLGAAMPKFYFEQDNDKDRRGVISTAVLVSAGASIVLTLLLVVTRDASSSLLFGNDNFATITGLFSILIVTNALEAQCLVYLQIQRKSGLYVTFNLVKLALQFSMNILFVVYLKLGVQGIAYASTLSASLFAATLSAYTFYHTGFQLSRDLAYRMIKFSWPLWVAGVAALYIGSSGRYYLRIFDSLDAVGLYELGAKFGGILTLLVAQPFARYWDTERFSYYKDENSAEIFQNIFRFYAALLVVTSLGIDIFAEPIIKIMAAPAFYTASYVVPFVTLSALARCLTDYCNFSFLITEKTGWISRNHYITAGLVTVFYLILTPKFGLVGAAISLMLAECIQFLIVQKTARQYFDMHIRIRPLAGLLGIASVGYLLANWTFRSQFLPFDIAFKAVIYLISVAVLLLLFWRGVDHNEQIMKFLAPLAARFSIGKSTKSN